MLTCAEPNRRLAVVLLSIVGAAAVVEHDVIHLLAIDVQVAVRSVVSVRLVISSVTKPPVRSISGGPSIAGGRRVHGNSRTTTAAICGARHIDNEVWHLDVGEAVCGVVGNLPVGAAGWGPNLPAGGATMRIGTSVYSQTVHHLCQTTSRVAGSSFFENVTVVRTAVSTSQIYVSFKNCLVDILLIAQPTNYLMNRM